MALIETESAKSRLSEAIRLAEGQLDDLTALAASLLEEIKAGDCPSSGFLAPRAA